MRKIFFTLTIFALIMAITGCPSGGSDLGKEGEKTAPVRKFWAMDTRNPAKINFYQINAQLLAENTRCEIWAEQGSDVDKGTAQSIANTYSGSIYNKMIDVFSSNITFNGKTYNNAMDFAHDIATGESYGKLTILLLDIKDSYQKGVNDSYVAGYFFPVDLFDQISANAMDNSPKTNQRDMIYIDTNPGLQYVDEVYCTLAHEMQHMMNFVFSIAYRSSVVDSKLYIYQMDTWIDEGLSSAAEWAAYGKHPDSKIQWYNEVKNKSGLLPKGNNFFVWGNREGNGPGESQYAILDDYATVYLFFQWLRLQSGKNIYKDIIKSPKKDYEAVTTAFDTRFPGQGYDLWNKVLGDWLAANYLQFITGPYGYRSDSVLNSLKKHFAPTGNSDINLYPGEGVYSYASPYQVPGNTENINYLGLTGTGVASGNITGALLTYNVSTNFTEKGDGTCEADFSSGTTTGAAPSANIVMSISGSGQGSMSSKPFPISMSDEIRRNGHKANFNITSFRFFKEAADE
jgi:hypothetical protein